MYHTTTARNQNLCKMSKLFSFGSICFPQNVLAHLTSLFQKDHWPCLLKGHNLKFLTSMWEHTWKHNMKKKKNSWWCSFFCTVQSVEGEQTSCSHNDSFCWATPFAKVQSEMIKIHPCELDREESRCTLFGFTSPRIKDAVGPITELGGRDALRRQLSFLPQTVKEQLRFCLCSLCSPRPLRLPRTSAAAPWNPLKRQEGDAFSLSLSFFRLSLSCSLSCPSGSC